MGRSFKRFPSYYPENPQINVVLYEPCDNDTICGRKCPVFLGSIIFLTGEHQLSIGKNFLF